MADNYESLLASIRGDDTQALIAKENPYYQWAAIPGIFAEGALKAQTTGKNPRSEMWGKAIAASLGGLLGGGLQGYGETYQNELTQRYSDAVRTALEGGNPSAEGLSPNLFGSAQRKGALMASLFLQQQVDDLLEIDKARKMAEAKIRGENDAWAADAPQPAAPARVVKPGLMPVATSVADGTTVVAEVPVVEELTPKPDPFALPEGNPNNPRYKDQLDKAKWRKDQIMGLEDKVYNRIKALPLTNQFTEIRANFDTLLSLAKEDSRPASVGMIASLSRIWDPGGTVREGEYALNANAQSALDNMIGDWRSIVLGKGKLDPSTKAKIISAVAQKYNAFGEQYQAAVGEHYKALIDQGGNPANIPIPQFTVFDTAEIPRYVPGLAAGGADLRATIAALKMKGATKEQVRQYLAGQR